MPSSTTTLSKHKANIDYSLIIIIKKLFTVVTFTGNVIIMAMPLNGLTRDG